MTSFLNFPDKREIFASLCEVEDLTLPTQQLFEAIAERLDRRTYDGAALSFLLMELIHEYEISWRQDLGPLLPVVIVALTGDRQLAAAARRAFEEIKRSLDDEEE